MAPAALAAWFIATCVAGVVAGRELNGPKARTFLTVLALSSVSLAALEALGWDLAYAAYGAALVSVLLVIGEIDRRHYLIPDALTLTAFALALLAPFGQGWPDNALGLALVGGLFLAVRQGFATFRSVDALGLGDVKFAAVLGFLLGPVGGLLAAGVGCGAMASLMIAQRVRGGSTVAVAPLGLGLAAAGVIALLARAGTLS